VSATGAAYTVELELLAADVATGPIARMEKSCAPCTFDEANEMMSNAATQLHDGVGTMVPVRVSTDPPGATIELDGKAVGTAPLDLDVLPGDHVFRAKLAGRADAQVTSSVSRQSGGDAQIVALSLPTGPVEAVHEDTGGPGPYRIWKWAATGGAVAAVASGIWLIAIDGDQTGCPPGPGQCPDFYSTMAGGVTLTLTGVALGGLATWMFLSDHPRESSAVAAQPVAGGAVLYFRKTF
jgi:hypothetical protein